MQRKGQDLKHLLERAQQSYAYEVMALQIEIDQKNQNGESSSRIESISRLLQLYMVGVEVLESKSDPRYKYFSLKINSLMKKRIILEEMQRASSTKIQSEIIQQAKKAEMGEKKQDYNLQMYLNNEQVNAKKVREIVDIAENKLKRLSNRVQGAMISQDKELEERIRRRKMRSEAGSVQKFKFVKGQVLDRNIVGEKLQDFFDPWQIKLKRGMQNSDGKDSNKKT